jgi:hypothetical protein
MRDWFRRLMCRWFNLVPGEETINYEVWPPPSAHPRSQPVFVVPERKVSEFMRVKLVPGAVLTAEMMDGLNIIWMSPESPLWESSEPLDIMPVSQ